VIPNRFDPDVMENVPSDMSLGDAIAYNSAFSSILFVLERVDVEQQRAQVDALSRLMNASAVFDRLPELKQDASNGRERVHNFVVEYLRRRSESARFSAQQQDVMKIFMTAMVNVLWALDGQHEKFTNSAHVDQIPKALISPVVF